MNEWIKKKKEKEKINEILIKKWNDANHMQYGIEDILKEKFPAKNASIPEFLETMHHPGGTRSSEKKRKKKNIWDDELISSFW